MAYLRDRESSDLRPIVWSVRYTPSEGAGETALSTNVTELWTRYGRISDVSQSKRTVKPVSHSRAWWFPTEIPLHLTDISVSWYSMTLQSPVSHYLPYGGLITPFGASPLVWPPTPTEGLKAELADEAFDAFFTQVPQEVDIANFVIDLRDLGSLVPQVQETALKTFAGGYLNGSFGWKPLIGDLKKLSSLLDTVRSRLAWLRSTYGKRTPLGFSSDFDVVTSNLPTQTTTYDLNLVESQGRFVAGCYLLHRLENLDGLMGELRGLIGALGLNSPGKILWERIPFSFVLDWVSRVGRFADKGTIQPFSGEWNVLDLSHSWKQTVTWEVRVKQSTTLSYRGSIAGRLVVQTYVRDQGLPLSSALFYGRELTPQQLALSAALVGAASR